jgi:hypothetical protein
MKKIDFGQAISTLANLGVIGGLIFVGLQLEQDRELAAIDRRMALSESRKYWAELLTENAEIWAKGISGQELTPEEFIRFNALAEARDTEHWQNWANSGSEAFGEVAVDILELRQGFVRQAAHEYSSNPGLLDWYREYQNVMRRFGQYGDFENSVNEEIDRLLTEQNSE